MSSLNRPVVVVLGGINMDLVGSTDRLPIAGETVFGKSFHTAPGGKGANQAVAAARLGAHVRMVGRVGADDFGTALVDGMRREGIDVSGVAIDPDNPTGIAMIILDRYGENCIVAIYGANMACDEAQVESVAAALDGADILLLQLETPLDVAKSAAKLAVDREIRVVWDPAPAVDMGPDAFALCDVLTPNQVEAQFLTGVEVTDPASAREAGERLVAEGASAAVVKLGEGGAYYTTGDAGGFVAPFQVEVMDTVAAGDAFAAGLSVALAEGRDLESAVRFGSAAGALAVTCPGAQQAMPSRVDVDRIFRIADVR